MKKKILILISLSIAMFAAKSQEDSTAASSGDDMNFLDLSLEELLNMEVTSVSKKAERLQDVASSIYVVTNSDIIRSGATTLHEVLRTVPGYWGVQDEYSSVDPQIRSSIASNGSKGGILYLLDGTPIQNLMTSTFSFENFDIPLDEIDRIEVIRGSGGVLYGANSTTGVINIFTKNPEKYDGVSARVEAASPSYANVTLRGGGKINDQLSISGYGKVRLFGGFGTLPEFDGETVTVPNATTGRDTTITNRFTEDFESINTYSGGLKAAYKIGDNSKISLAGHYNLATQKEYTNFETDMMFLGASDSLVLNEVSRSRIVGNLRFDHNFTDKHSLFVRTSTNIEDNFTKSLGGYYLNNSILDFEIQDNLSIGSMNDLSFGVNQRIVNFNISEINDSDGFSYIDPQNTEHLSGVFLQDKVKFFDGKLNLILGAKAENYSLINDEYYISPMAKISYILDESITFWGGYTQSYTTPGYDLTNIDALLAKAIPDDIATGIVTQGIYENAYNQAYQGAIGAGADEETADAQAMAQANGFLASEAGQEAIVQGKAQFPPNIGLINGSNTEPTKYQTFEAGFRTNVENILSLESNFYYSNVTDALAPSANRQYLESPTHPGRFADYFLYGNYLKGINFGLESMVRIIPSSNVQFEFSHVYSESKWEFQENDDFDIYDTDIVDPDDIDRTPSTPAIPKHVLRFKGAFSLPKNFRMDLGLIYATKFSSNEAQYDYVNQRYPNILDPLGTLVATNKERTIVNLRIEKNLMDNKLNIYAFGQDIFNEGLIAQNETLQNVTLTQIRAMYGLGLIYKIR